MLISQLLYHILNVTFYQPLVKSLFVRLLRKRLSIAKQCFTPVRMFFQLVNGVFEINLCMLFLVIAEDYCLRVSLIAFH